MNLPIIQKKFWFVGLSSLFVTTSIVFYFIWGLNLGIDFTGGSLLEVKFVGERPGIEAVEASLAKIEVKSLTVQATDQNGMILRFQNTDEAKHQEVMTKLRELVVPVKTDKVKAAQPKIEADKNIKVEAVPVGQSLGTAGAAVEELRFESAGPSIGRQLRSNAITSLIIIALLIIAYIAWTFRKVSRPVAAWKYGMAGVIAIFHDVVIVVGAFSLLGHLYGIEVGTPFVAALLTIFGYSINDTIVVFDRIRENLPKSHQNFEGTVNFSVNQTIKRSAYSSATVLLTLLAVILYGGESIKYFALALFIGIFFGAYSSIFLASPLLVLFEKYKKS
jgi:preprotein translocase subunit SecF